MAAPRPGNKDICRSLFFGLIMLLYSAATAWAAGSDPWLLIDTRKESLVVMGQNGPLEKFENIALGVRGAGIKHRRGDEITPLGSFKVGWISQESRFHRFIGLNYPNLEYASLAYYDGRIDKATYQAIGNALREGKRPPQQTALGGYLGIHGIGAGDPYIHENINWTNGCVALTNQQIKRLLAWVKVGMRVEIR
jgi:murein L,D-transpeptidase YafK